MCTLSSSCSCFHEVRDSWPQNTSTPVHRVRQLQLADYGVCCRRLGRVQCRKHLRRLCWQVLQAVEPVADSDGSLVRSASAALQARTPVHPTKCVSIAACVQNGLGSTHAGGSTSAVCASLSASTSSCRTVNVTYVFPPCMVTFSPGNSSWPKPSCPPASAAHPCAGTRRCCCRGWQTAQHAPPWWLPAPGSAG